MSERPEPLFMPNCHVQFLTCTTIDIPDLLALGSIQELVHAVNAQLPQYLI